MFRTTGFTRVRAIARAVVIAAASATSVALAQPGPSPVPYRSAFDGYRAWSDPVPANWRAVNDDMLRLGGHAGHLRDTGTQRADPKPADAQRRGNALPPATPASRDASTVGKTR